jgi:hypothetical protein
MSAAPFIEHRLAAAFAARAAIRRRQGFLLIIDIDQSGGIAASQQCPPWNNAP